MFLQNATCFICLDVSDDVSCFTKNIFVFSCGIHKQEELRQNFRQNHQRSTVVTCLLKEQLSPLSGGMGEQLGDMATAKLSVEHEQLQCFLRNSFVSESLVMSCDVSWCFEPHDGGLPRSIPLNTVIKLTPTVEGKAEHQTRGAVEVWEWWRIHNDEWQ